MDVPLSILGAVAEGQGWVWLLLLLGAVLGGFVFLRVRRQRQTRELLFRDAVRGPEAAPQPVSPAPSFVDEPGFLRSWLASAGYDGPNAPLQFLLWTAAAFLGGAFVALLIEASGVTERAVTWIEGVPGGVADLFAPVMGAATWLLAVLVALLPVAWVRRERRRLTDEVERDLPTVLSLLATLVESGMGFDAAAQRVELALGDDRVLAGELARVRATTLAGVPRAGAIRAMAQRLDVPSLTTFSSALVHAENQGASIGDTLRRQATDLWNRRREDAIQRAQTLPTKLAFPLVICFLPGVFVWTFGPAVSEFIKLVGNTVSAGQ